MGSVGGLGSTGGTQGGDIGGISTPALTGSGYSGASFPFGAGLATPFGNLGANLPAGLSLPASSGALGLGLTAATGSPMAGRFGNAALGGLPGIAGFGVSEGANALGAPKVLSSVLGMLAGRAIPFGAPPIAGLGALNSLLGMAITTAQNRGSVNSLNTLANPQNTLTSLMADPNQFGTPQVQSLGRFSATPEFSQMASQMMTAPVTIPQGMQQSIQNAQLALLANALDIAYAPFGSAVSPHAGLGFGGVDFGLRTGQFGAATGVSVPGSTNFGMGSGDSGGTGGTPGGGAGVGPGGDAP